MKAVLGDEVYLVVFSKPRVYNMKMQFRADSGLTEDYPSR